MMISTYYHFFWSRRSSIVSQKGQTEYFHLILRSDHLKITDDVDKYKKLQSIWYDKMTYLNDQSVLLIFVLFFFILFQDYVTYQMAKCIEMYPCESSHDHVFLTFTLFVVKMFCHNAKDIEIQVHSMALFSHPEN